MTIIRIVALLILLTITGLRFHPLKLSYSEVIIDKNKVTIKSKIFADDLAVCLEKILKKRVDLESCSWDQHTKSGLINYYNNNFQILNNNKLVTIILKEIKCEEDAGSNTKVITMIFTSRIIQKEGLKLRNSLMFNGIPEQKNVVTFKTKEGNTLNTTVYDQNDKETLKDIIL